MVQLLTRPDGRRAGRKMPQHSNLAREKKRPGAPRAFPPLLAYRMSDASQGHGPAAQVSRPALRQHGEEGWKLQCEGCAFGRGSKRERAAISFRKLARDGEAVAVASGVEAGIAATPDFDVASNLVMLIEANIIVGFRENA